MPQLPGNTRPLRFVRSAAHLAVALALSLSVAASAAGQCVGDCNGNGVVGISELIVAVNIAIGDRDLADCPVADANGNGMVSIGELITAVNNSLNGCPIAGATDTPTSTPTVTPTATATPTTAPAIGPQIHLFALAAADVTLAATPTVENGIPVYQLQFGRSFHIIVEAGAGESGINPGSDTFRSGGPPSFQIQATRPLGNGSSAVCDADLPGAGGVPGIDPPSFAATPMIEDALNDLGCRFLDGSADQQPAGRGCNDAQACLRFEDGTFGCASPQATLQYCSRIISSFEEFPIGDTLLSARVMECRGCPIGRPELPGPVAQIIVRVLPPFGG